MTTSNPLDRFRQAAWESALDLFTAGRLKGTGAVSADDWQREMDMTTERITAAAVELVNSELTDFWTSLTPDENIMRAAENYQKFCDRIDALMTTSNSQPCTRCGGTGKNPDNSVLGWPGKPCYICLGTGKAPTNPKTPRRRLLSPAKNSTEVEDSIVPADELMELLRGLEVHYGWVSKTPKVAGRGVTHMVNGDLKLAHAQILKWADARFEAAKQPPAIRTAKPADVYEKGYDHGWDDAIRIASERWYKGDRAEQAEDAPAD